MLLSEQQSYLFFQDFFDLTMRIIRATILVKGRYYHEYRHEDACFNHYANHNFSRVTKIVEEHGSALILKNNAPKYLMLDLTTVDEKSVESIMKKASTGKKSSK